MEIFQIVLKVLLILLVSIPAPYSYFKKLNLFKSKLWLALAILSIAIYAVDIIVGLDIKFLILDTIIVIGYIFVFLENTRIGGK